LNLLNIMAESKADFTQTFYALSKLKNEKNNEDQPFKDLFSEALKIDSWLAEWRSIINKLSIDELSRLKKMTQVNPIIIPRNHQVEKVIRAAEDNNDFEPFFKLNTVLKSPYTFDQNKTEYMATPNDIEVVERTFCGT
jgi:uncharacterized protein YdiU (UPF0061 family)